MAAVRSVQNVLPGCVARLRTIGTAQHGSTLKSATWSRSLHVARASRDHMQIPLLRATAPVIGSAWWLALPLLATVVYSDSTDDAAVVRRLLSDIRTAQDAASASRACTALCNVVYAVGDGEKELLMREGALTTLASVLRRPELANDAKVATAVLAAFTNFAKAPTVASAIADEMPLIVATMQRHAGNPAVAEYACACMAYVCKGKPREGDAVVTSGALAAVLEAMRRHEAHAGLAARACDVIANLRGERNLGAVVAGGGVPLIMTVLSHHRSDSNAVGYACFALAALSHAPVGVNALVADAATTASELIGAMEAHPDMYMMTRYVPLVLAAMASHSEASLRAVDAAHAVAALNSLARHSIAGRDGFTIFYIYQALSVLAQDAPARSQMAAAGAVETALDQLTRRDFPDMTVRVLHALAYMVTGDAAMRKDALARNGKQRCIEAVAFCNANAHRVKMADELDTAVSLLRAQRML